MATAAATSLQLRPATEADLLAYIGHDIEAEWRPWLAEWTGYVVEQPGENGNRMVGVGCISADHYGRLWAWVHTREPLSPVLVHRNVVKMLGLLRQAGADAVHCYRDDELPGSERWLRRLGFRPAPEMTTARDKMVWKVTFIGGDARLAQPSP